MSETQYGKQFLIKSKTSVGLPKVPLNSDTYIQQLAFKCPSVLPISKIDEDSIQNFTEGF